MNCINKLIKLKDKYPQITDSRLYSLFLARNLPLPFCQPNNQAEIAKKLIFLDHFFKVALFTPEPEIPLSMVWSLIPTCSPQDYDLEAENLFNNFICLHHRNQTGTFHTSATVASHLVQMTTLGKINNNCSYLDPACGTGIFLKACLAQFIGTGPEKLAFIKDSLYGIDLNPHAVEVSKFLLLTAALREYPEADDRLDLPDLTANFRSENSLESDQPLLADYIFCNPPFGLSRNQQIDAQELTRLKKRYGQIFSGKLNKYLLFAYHCYRCLKPAGRAGIITPNSWLGIRDGQKLREYLISNQAWDTIVSFEENIFPKLGVETIFNIITKQPTQNIMLLRYNSNFQVSQRYQLSYQTLKKSPTLVVPLHWKDSYDQILNQVETSSLALRDPEVGLTASIALQVYLINKGTPPQSAKLIENQQFHHRQKLADNYHRYLLGRDLEDGHVNWSGSYLHYGPWVAEYQSLQKYQIPRVLVREVLGRPPHLLRTTYTSEEFLYNRSILHIHASGDYSSKLLPAIAVLLRSKFASFYLLLRGRKANRKLFPKIVVDDLKDFPIPKTLLVNPDLLVNPPVGSLLDHLIYTQYSLSLTQIEEIEETLRAWTKTT